MITIHLDRTMTLIFSHTESFSIDDKADLRSSLKRRMLKLSSTNDLTLAELLAGPDHNPHVPLRALLFDLRVALQRAWNRPAVVPLLAVEALVLAAAWPVIARRRRREEGAGKRRLEVALPLQSLPAQTEGEGRRWRDSG